MAAPDFPAPSFPVYDEPVQIAKDMIANIDERIENFSAQADAVFEALASFQGPDVGSPPNIVPAPIPVPSFPASTPPSAQLFGDVDPIEVPDFEGIDPEIASLASQLISDLSELPAFFPSVGAPNLPTRPPPPADQSQNLANLLADKPVISDVDLPAAPNVYDPGVGELVPFTIPVIPELGALPVFDAAVSVFDTDVPDGILQWEEPTYVPTVRNEVVAVIKRMLEGDFAMPDAVLNALLGQSQDAELKTTRKQVDEAMSEYGRRGYEMPPGMLVAAVDNARQEGALRENDRVREILKLKGEWSVQNLRTAVASGIELEAQLITYFNSFAERAFGAAKFVVESQRLLFDSRVALFNAQNAQLNILCTVYQTRLAAVLAPLQIVKAQLEVQQLIGVVNNQMLEQYKTRVAAMELLVNTFNSLMNGAKIKSEIQRDRIEAWKGEIEGFSAYLNAVRLPYEIYKTEVEAEGTKAQILEAEARAYAATVEGFSAKENVKIAVLNGELKAIDSATQRFVAKMGAQRDVAASQSETIRARASAYSADVGRYGEELKFSTTAAQVTVQSQEATVRNNMAYFETKSRQYDALAQRIIAIAQLQLEGIKAAGSIASNLAAGAMSSEHVQAGVSGSGSASTSSGYSYSEQHSFDETE